MLKSSDKENQNKKGAVASGVNSASVHTGQVNSSEAVSFIKNNPVIFSRIVNELNSSVIIISADGSLLFFNKKFSNYIGKPDEQIMGMNIFSLIAQEHRESFRELVLKGLEQKVISEFEVKVDYKPAVHFISFELYPVEINGVKCVCVISSDTSERKRKENELLSEKVELERRNRERTEELERLNRELIDSRYAALNMMEDAVEAKAELEKVNLNLRNEIKERKQIEQSLRESEERFRNIFRNSLAVMFLIDPETYNLVDVNYAAERFYGWSHEEMINLRIDDLNTLLPEQIAVEMEKAASKDQTLFESKHRLSNGLVRDVDVYISRIKILGKIYLHSIVIDSTERKKAELINRMQYNIANAVITADNTKSLFEAIHKELSNVLDATHFFIALYNDRTKMFYSVVDTDKDEIRDWPAEGSLSGYVINQKRSVFLKKADILKLAEQMEIKIIGSIAEYWLGVPLIIEERILGILVVQSYSSGDIYDQTSIDLLEVVAHELSIFFEKIEAEEEAFILSRAIEQSPVSVVITDSMGNIEYVNPHFCKVTGYSSAEAIGQNPRILKSGEKSQEEYKELWDTILSGKEWYGEFHNKRKNGELYWEKAVISPIVNQEGEITNFCAIKEDITEKKKMIEELVTAKEKAEEMSRLKSHFLANMSHELRTPLIGILGFSEIMLEDLEEPALRQMAETINRSGTRLLDTLNLILDLSRVEAGRLEIKRETVDVTKIISGTVNLFSEAAARKGLYLRTDLSDESLIIKSDPKLLEQILNNLINNAIKFTREGGVTVTLESGPDRIRMSVADTGIGISPADQKIIWEEFRQASEGFSRNFEGTGLGLTLTKKFVEKLGGTVNLESELGKGSVFTVELPVHPENSLLTQEVISEEKPIVNNLVTTSASMKTKILLVEDDPVAIDLVKAMLGPTYEIEVVIKGQEAIESAAQKIYDLILMDINLGKGINGLEVTKAIRKMPEYKTVPIIAVTAFAMVGDKEEFLAAGCSHYLSKPYTRKQLLSLIQEALAERKDN